MQVSWKSLGHSYEVCLNPREDIVVSYTAWKPSGCDKSCVMLVGSAGETLQDCGYLYLNNRTR